MIRCLNNFLFNAQLCARQNTLGTLLGASAALEQRFLLSNSCMYMENCVWTIVRELIDFYVILYDEQVTACVWHSLYIYEGMIPCLKIRRKCRISFSYLRLCFGGNLVWWSCSVCVHCLATMWFIIHLSNGKIQSKSSFYGH